MKNSNQSVTIQEALNMAVTHYQSGQTREAENICKQVLKSEPRNADTLHLMGVIACQKGQYKNATKFIRQAILANKSIPSFYSNLGFALQSDGLFEEAIEQYKKALALNPSMPEVHMNLGNALRELDRLDESLMHLGQSIALNPNAAEACYNLGLTLQRQGKDGEAEGQYKKAISLNPLLFQARTNLGTIFKSQGRLNEAIEQYEQALILNPAAAETYTNFGLALHDLRRYDEAVARYQQALALDPDNADTHCGLGITYKSQKKLAESIEEYTKACTLDPDSQSALGELLHQLYHACTWDGISRHEKKLLEMAREGREGISPFTLLGVAGSTPADHRTCARAFSRRYDVPASVKFRPSRSRPESGKIRIGYLSSDYYQHATACLMAELFERHDRARFEITGYSYGPDDNSAMRQRLVKAFDRFIDLRRLPHEAAARKIFDDGTDILIDLKGYTGDSWLQIPAYRPAPIQVNYLGYPGTMGVDFIDYIITDPFITPMEHQPFYSEKIVQLPDCYQPNDTKREIAATPTRAACGLPEQGFVFCCFNSPYKITSDVFDVWTRLLNALPGSVLWLLEANTLVKSNLIKEAAKRGIGAERLVFAPNLPLPQHLARHRLADLFLDTLPINAHTTASDALWAGLPVVTCSGDSFASRVAGSLLKAAGLPELVTFSLKDYEELALRLARDPATLSGLKQRLEQTRQTVPLFDIAKFVKNIESAYQTMYQAWRAGEQPKPFAVPRS